MISLKLNYLQVKFGANPFISFEDIGQKCDFIRMIHMIRIRRLISLNMFHFLADIKGNFLT